MGVIASRSLSIQLRYQKFRRMSDTEDVPVKSPAAKAAAKKSAAKAAQGQASSHPKYADMVATTIEAIASRGGCSRQAILKKIKEDFDVGDNERRVAINVNMTLKKGVESGKLKMAREKGKGAGSYKLGEKPKPEKKKPVKRLSDKTVVKKAAKITEKTKTLPKKTVTTKSKEKSSAKRKSIAVATKKPKAGTPSKKKAAAKKTPSKNVKKSGAASKTAAKKTPSKASKPIKKTPSKAAKKSSVKPSKPSESKKKTPKKTGK